jgi:threonine synthase
VAYLGLKEFLKSIDTNAVGIFLETAHPAKFKDVVDETLQASVPIPKDLQKFLKHPKKSIPLSNDYQSFKAFLNANF